MLHLEGLLEKRVFAEIKHAETEVQTGAEVCGHLADLLGIQRFSLHG
jgi:hypothetical protein